MNKIDAIHQNKNINYIIQKDKIKTTYYPLKSLDNEMLLQ